MDIDEGRVRRIALAVGKAAIDAAASEGGSMVEAVAAIDAAKRAMTVVMIDRAMFDGLISKTLEERDMRELHDEAERIMNGSEPCGD